MGKGIAITAIFVKE